MSLMKKIAKILSELERGAVLTLPSGHTITLADNGEPGFVTWNGQNKENDMLMMVGSSEAYMGIVALAKVREL